MGRARAGKEGILPTGRGARGAASKTGAMGGEGDASHKPTKRRHLRPRDLLAALHDRGVEFVIIGGFSLAAHGHVRATKDIDIVPAPDAANLQRLADALQALEAEVDIGDLSSEELGLRPDAEGLRGGGNWVLQTCFGRLDVMQDVKGLRSWEDLRIHAIEFDGSLYSGYEQLVRMKTASAREEDLRDLRALEAARSAEGA